MNEEQNRDSATTVAAANSRGREPTDSYESISLSPDRGDSNWANVAAVAPVGAIKLNGFLSVGCRPRLHAVAPPRLFLAAFSPKMAISN